MKIVVYLLLFALVATVLMCMIVVLGGCAQSAWRPDSAAIIGGGLRDAGEIYAESVRPEPVVVYPQYNPAYSPVFQPLTPSTLRNGF